MSFGMTPGLDQENRDSLPVHDASHVNCYGSVLSAKGSRVIVTGGAGCNPDSTHFNYVMNLCGGEMKVPAT
jgi:hypothetical protein